jgi:hypothetical protein
MAGGPGSKMNIASQTLSPQSQVSGWGWTPAQPSGTAWHVSVLGLAYMLLKGLPDVSGRKHLGPRTSKLCGWGGRGS